MNTRLFKVQDLLHKEVAFLLLKEIQNPLIKAITISGVKVSKDLKYSEIYFTTLQPNHKKKCDLRWKNEILNENTNENKK